MKYSSTRTYYLAAAAKGHIEGTFTEGGQISAQQFRTFGFWSGAFRQWSKVSLDVVFLPTEAPQTSKTLHPGSL